MAPRQRPRALLERLESARLERGTASADRKLEILATLAPLRFGRAADLLRFHETLCFLAAYPDDTRVLTVVDGLLRAFSKRPDLRRHRARLVDTGVAGCAIRYRFFWPMARWCAGRWPDRLRVDWRALDDPSALASALPRLVPGLPAAWLQARRPDPRHAVETLRGAAASGTFIVSRIEAIPGDDAAREAFHDGLDTPYVLEGGEDGPSRTAARAPGTPVVVRPDPLRRGRPDLAREVLRPPRSIRATSRAEGERLVDLAREMMITRARDLDAFGYGDPRDVRLVDDGSGLCWAMIGTLPERRPVLRTTYGYLTIQNGVPIGYVQSDALLGAVDVAFNTFETFRGGEAGFVFARTLAMMRRLFRARAYTIEPYQLGHGNAEGIASGAWWFYYKMGFRPRGAAIVSLAAREASRAAKRPGYRSGPRVLERLAGDYLYWEPDGVRAPRWPEWHDLGAAPLRDDAAAAAADRLGGGPRRGWNDDERHAWERWAPILLRLDGIERWSLAERLAAVAVVRAKGGVRDDRYLARLDAHAPLAAALRRLAGRAYGR